MSPIKITRPKYSELLMPAGSLSHMKTAILYGADAIYCGTPDLSLRTKSAFSLEDLQTGIKLCHENNVRVYLTLNLFTHNKDIEKLPKFIETIRVVKPDGVIIADPAVFQFIKDNAPELELHISTQANICSWLSVDYWHNQGASLVVMAREVSFNELSEIRERCPEIKLEAFVQGAMCMTYSGRCLLSNYMSERGANQGNCSHSCRWKYKLHIRLRDGKTEELLITEENEALFEFLLEEEIRPGDFMPIEEDLRGSYILNSKDLCLMPKLDDYLRIGVDSLKVEGRHKNPYYVAVVARAYRAAIDDYYKDPENWSHKVYSQELESIRNRGFTLAFHDGRLGNLAHDYETSASMGEWSYGGFIRDWDDDTLTFEIRNTIRSGDVIEFLPPKSHAAYELEVIRIRLYDFTVFKNDEKVMQVNPGQGQAIKIPLSAFDREDKNNLKNRLPIGTVARVETMKNVVASSPRTLLRNKAFKVEEGTVTQAGYERFKQKLGDSALPEKGNKQKPKTKEEACCGRGCNGCLIFWNDPMYEKARTLLTEKQKTQAHTRLDHKAAPV